MFRLVIRSMIPTTVLLLLCTLAFAQDPPGGESLSKGIDLLIRFFILAVVIEVAFATIFQWKVYLKYLHDKGFKTPIIVILSYIFCKTADLNILGQLVMALFGKDHQFNNEIGLFITALLLAGGSSAMHTLFSKLKIRDPVAIQKRAEDLQTELERKKAAINTNTEGAWKWIPRR